ncbi:hypothetical protein GCE86_18375 [Micromonospora terminaliae]|uniref:Uncharacterized protein n=1 Tax=Micromonospora terminaliae TaxID=1914461 RepID=A0AAJ2ZFX5_9ACTN|nr:hypothetical protein [Micromonospora terminaliae]NES29197.1 hypothetical protein [Micromonospora terminaliae]QGL48810.1 hypothetical protein GCE86_18375 [Micromonospora terminaliae]
MRAMVVTLVVFVALLIAVIGYVSWRDRNRRSSLEDSMAVRNDRADQARHEAERHFAQGEAARHRTPDGT